MFNIEYLAGTRQLDEGLKPALDLIVMQSWALLWMGIDVELELHWIPGHYHHVLPHQWADQFVVGARQRGCSFSARRGTMWNKREEPCVVGYLKEDLYQAASRAARCMPLIRRK